MLFRVSFLSLSNVFVVYGFVYRFRLLVMFLWYTVSCFVFVSFVFFSVVYGFVLLFCFFPSSNGSVVYTVLCFV